MLKYERILDKLAGTDPESAKALAGMGIPFRVLQGDPYWRKHYHHWTWAAVDNYPSILAQSKKRKVGLQDAPKSSTPAIVIGSGPSLTPAIRALQRWKGEIFCSNSNLYTLLANGIKPTHLVVLDAAGAVGNLVTRYKGTPKDITLVTHPMINPVLVAKWKRPAYYYLVQRRGNELFQWALPWMYSRAGIDVGLLWRICVTNSAVQVAGYLGEPMRPVFLVGADFGWRDRNESRCRTYEPTDDGAELREKPVAVPEDTPDMTEDSLGRIHRDADGIERMGDMTIKRDEFFQLWWGNHIPMIDCTGGYLHELPQADISDVVDKQGVGWDWVFEKRRETAKAVADYLNSRVAAKREQWSKIMEEHDEKVSVGAGGAADDTGGVDGGGSGERGEAGPGA